MLRPQMVENWLCGTQDPHLEAPDHLELIGLELLGQIQSPQLESTTYPGDPPTPTPRPLILIGPSLLIMRELKTQVNCETLAAQVSRD